MSQTQETVIEWCDLHYPGETTMQKLRNTVEELGELANEMDADVEDLVAVLRKSMARPKEGTREALRGEVGDLQISVYNLAGAVGERADDCLDAKMAKLATRTPDETAARVKRKMALGLRNEVGHPEKVSPE